MSTILYDKDLRRSPMLSDEEDDELGPEEYEGGDEDIEEEYDDEDW